WAVPCTHWTAPPCTTGGRPIPAIPGWQALGTSRVTDLSAEEARWLAIEAQGLGRPRPNPPVRVTQLRRAIAAVGTVQLDAINVLERTQRLVLFSRVGSYDVERFHRMALPGGELFEYWGHAASLQPTVLHPLFRWRMAQAGPYGGGPTIQARRQAWRDEHAGHH